MSLCNFLSNQYSQSSILLTGKLWHSPPASVFPPTCTLFQEGGFKTLLAIQIFFFFYCTLWGLAPSVGLFFRLFFFSFLLAFLGRNPSCVYRRRKWSLYCLAFTSSPLQRWQCRASFLPCGVGAPPLCLPCKLPSLWRLGVVLCVCVCVFTYQNFFGCVFTKI